MFRQAFKYSTVIVTLICLIAGLTALACGCTPQTVSTSSATASSTQKPAETITLKFSTALLPTNQQISLSFEPWINEVERLAEGRVKIELYTAEALLKSADHYRGLVEGVADIAVGSHGKTPGQFPLISVMELPFLSPTSEIGTRIITELYQSIPEMQLEHDDVHLMELVCTTSTDIHTNKKVSTLADLKGIKIAGNQGAAVQMENLGCVPVVMPPTDFYTSLEKGVVDGVAMPWGAVGGWKLYEVTKFHTNAGLGSTTMWYAMNKDTWSKLPADIQQIITDTSHIMADGYLEAANIEGNQTIETVKNLGHTIIDLSPEEKGKMISASKPTWDKWVASIEDQNLPGQVVADKAAELLEKYR